MRTALPLLLLLSLAIALSGCARHSNLLEGPDRQITNWHRVATVEDKARVRQWRDSLIAGLAAARAGGYGLDLDRQGELLEPEAASGEPAIPAGHYQCRRFKLGAIGSRTIPYAMVPATPCRVTTDGALLHFATQDDTQRFVGTIYPDSRARMIFLGFESFGDERIIIGYGRDRLRDVVGIVEKIGAQRWRMLLPAPHFDSVAEVVDLTPAN